MKKRLMSLMLCLSLVLGLTLTARADPYSFDLGQAWDESIVSGGIYDLFAWVGDDAQNYTFQWQADAAFGGGSWMDLTDNANPYGYRGTQTYHLELVTSMENGQIIGTGWEQIPFRCVVTHKATGAVRTTPDMFMKIYTCDNLEDYFTHNDLGLYEPYVDGSIGSVTSSGNVYYATAPAGKSIRMNCGIKPPESVPTLERSEMTAQVEMWITEAGKTVKKENGGAYIPHTVGKNTVTVQFKARYTLGIHDLGYLETKTLQLSTQAPDTVGYGTAKVTGSLLLEQYNESQKLVSIPKGTRVAVTGQSGSWYQVVYAGFIGYVPVTALDYDATSPIIDHVNVNITEPVAGALPATTCTVTTEKCSVTYVDWMDVTESRFLTSGEKFLKGHTYRMVVWVTAAEGYSFKLDVNENMKTTATVNGALPAFTARAYEQIIGKVVEITYDFSNVQATPSHTCQPEQVDYVAPTCVKPGHSAYYQCQCGKAYSNASATQQIDPATWGILPATGHQAGSWTGNGTHHYQKCTQCKQVISSTNAPHSGGKEICGQKPICPTCGLSYGSVVAHDYDTKLSPVLDQGHAHLCRRENCTASDTVKPHTPGPEATETTAQTCKDCGYVITPAGNHTHTYQKVEAVAATCLGSGSKEYYSCQSCSGWWWDPEGKASITDKTQVIVPALGHTATGVWEWDEDGHWQTCVICMAPVEEAPAKHTDEDADGNCDACGYALPLSGEPAKPEALEKTTPQPSSGADWLTPVLVGVVCFCIAITSTVIILKKKH